MLASAANTFLVYLDVLKLSLSTLHFCDFVNLDLSQAIVLGLEARLFDRLGSIPGRCVVKSGLCRVGSSKDNIRSTVGFPLEHWTSSL